MIAEAYPYETETRGHVWKRESDGSIDIFAGGDDDRHNGPACVNCGYSFCHHCESVPDNDCPATTPELKHAFDLQRAEEGVKALREALARSEEHLAKLRESE